MHTVSAPRPVPATQTTGLPYSMLPQFRDSYGLSVFLATDPDTQLRRIAARGGANKLEAFRTRWIPMEKAYHDAFGVRSACRFAIDT